MLISIILFGCQQKTLKEQLMSNLVDQVYLNITRDSDDDSVIDFCDTTKVKDFKTNLKVLNETLTDDEKEYQFEQADNFIKRLCEIPQFLCVELNYKNSTIYQYNDEWKLVLTGYVVEQEVKIREKSANLLVLTILRNNEFWATEILTDLTGEIQVELNGFEINEKKATIWGYLYPYSQSDYGKFRLRIQDKMSHYEFQCSS